MSVRRASCNRSSSSRSCASKSLTVWWSTPAAPLLALTLRLASNRFCGEYTLSISVCHLPPGTSKWNAIEHRLFAFISQNWRATPLVSYRVIVDLIGATTTRTGLSVRCELDPNRYPKGVTVSDAEMAELNIARDEFHGEWNYTLSPRPPDQALVP